MRLLQNLKNKFNNIKQTYKNNPSYLRVDILLGTALLTIAMLLIMAVLWEGTGR